MAVREDVDIMQSDRIAREKSIAMASYITTPPATPQSLLPAASKQQPSTIAQKAPSTAMSLDSKMIACVRCKQKKIKCDAREPSCSACVRAKEKCLVPDMVTGKSFPRGHIERLENRISELQSLIDTKNRELRDIKDRHGSFSSYYTNSMTSTPFSPAKRSSATSIPQSYMEDSVILSKEDETQADLALARLFIQTLHLKDHGPCICKLSHLVSHEKITSFESISPAGGLPPQPTAMRLCEAYLKSEQLCFPFLEQEDILAMYQRVYGELAVNRIPDPQDHFRIFMVFAIATLSYPDNSNSSHKMALRFYKAALTFLGPLPMLSGLAAVQNILLLCLFSLNAKISQDAWRLSRRALHVCIQSELHLSQTTKNPKSDEEEKADRLKQRVFWSSYCLNRLTSNLIYDRPPSIPEAEIDLETPPDLDQTSFLSYLSRLYHLSTTAFTSFNSSPPPGTTLSKLKTYISDLEMINGSMPGLYQNDQSPTTNAVLAEKLPLYATLSYSSHSMLILQWAITSLASQYNGVPSDIQNLAINQCINTIQIVAAQSQNGYIFGHVRLALFIMLRGLVILLSALLARPKPVSDLEVRNGADFSAERLDEGVVTAINFLLDVGKNQGQGNEYIYALVLAIRYAVFERERKERDGIVELEQGPFGDRELEYISLRPLMQGRFPRLSQVAREIGIEELSIGVGLRTVKEICEEEEPFPPSYVFTRFGQPGKEVEELYRQVRWRLKVQYEVGDSEGSLQAFETRMGTGNVVEGGVLGSVFNRRVIHEMDIEDHREVVGGEATGYGGDWNGMPKMDVDFSGFETDIVTFE